LYNSFRICYVGHSFRRTSATVLVEAGADKETLMRHGKWKSSKVAEGYVDSFIRYKKQAANLIASAILPKSSSTGLSKSKKAF